MTLLLTESYLPGAMTLAQSLRDTHTSKKLSVMVDNRSLSESSLRLLKVRYRSKELTHERIYDYVIPVNTIKSTDMSNLYLLGRPDLHSTFTKVEAWTQTQFRKIVFLDADTLVLKRIDEVFDLEYEIAAVPDVGWPDIFNTVCTFLKETHTRGFSSSPRD